MTAWRVARSLASRCTRRIGADEADERAGFGVDRGRCGRATNVSPRCDTVNDAVILRERAARVTVTRADVISCSVVHTDHVAGLEVAAEFCSTVGVRDNGNFSSLQSNGQSTASASSTPASDKAHTTRVVSIAWDCTSTWVALYIRRNHYRAVIGAEAWALVVFGVQHYRADG